jgi:ABC-type sugar transport system ATPase subunit
LDTVHQHRGRGDRADGRPRHRGRGRARARPPRPARRCCRAAACARALLRDVSFDLHAARSTASPGLMGAGRTEVARRRSGREVRRRHGSWCTSRSVDRQPRRRREARLATSRRTASATGCCSAARARQRRCLASSSCHEPVSASSTTAGRQGRRRHVSKLIGSAPRR